MFEGRWEFGVFESGQLSEDRSARGGRAESLAEQPVDAVSRFGESAFGSWEVRWSLWGPRWPHWRPVRWGPVIWSPVRPLRRPGRWHARIVLEAIEVAAEHWRSQKQVQERQRRHVD